MNTVSTAKFAVWSAPFRITRTAPVFWIANSVFDPSVAQASPEIWLNPLAYTASASHSCGVPAKLSGTPAIRTNATAHMPIPHESSPRCGSPH